MRYSLFVLLLASCAAEQSLELGTTAGMSFEEFRARTPRETATGYYIVDWDRVVTSDEELMDLWGRTQQGALAIFNNGADLKWNDAQKRQLTYCVGASFGNRRQAVIDAIAAATENGWEKFAGVNFIHVAGEDANCTAQNANVVFDVNLVQNQPFLARAFFPGDSRRNRNVLVDLTSFDPGSTGGIPLANILGHELGHTLGFRHEHIRPEARAGGDCAEDTQFRGVTTYDSASVMHYPQCNGTSATLAFTQRDADGVRSVYGAPIVRVAPMAQLVAPRDGERVGLEFDVEASVVDTDLAKAELFLDGVSLGQKTVAPFTFHVAGATEGEHVLEIVATDTTQLVTRVEVNVTVEAPVVDTPGQTPPTGEDPGAEPDADAEGAETGDISGGCSSAPGGGLWGGALALFALVGKRNARRRRRG